MANSKHKPPVSSQRAVDSLYKGAFVNQQPELIEIRSNALEYWLNELSTKDELTRKNYERYFKDFLNYLNTTADKLLEQRMQHLEHDDIKVQRTIESYFLQFLRDIKKARNYENGTMQVVFASIRSFFEMHYVPLRTRRKDYPKNTPNGVRRANKEALLKVLTNYKPRNKHTFNAVLMALKDSGLRVLDLLALNCDVILNNKDKTIIPITVKTEKTGYIAKTFFGTDAITAIKEYLKYREKGTKFVEPETITPDSPLFRIQRKGKPKRMTRTNASMLIRNGFLAIGEKRMSAHSLRKKLQTDLEKAGVNPNWIDQILGHELINSRDAYSLPTDEELQEAYNNAYNLIRLSPDITTSPKQITTLTTNGQEEYSVAEARSLAEAKQILAKGYKFEMDYGNVKLFKKRK